MRGRQRSGWLVLPVRLSEGRLLGGVCSGLAEASKIDVTLVRLAFMVMSITWGVGVGLYGLLWLLMPAESASGQLELRRRVRQNFSAIGGELRRTGDEIARSWHQSGRKSWPRPLDRRWAAITLITAGGLIILASLGAFEWLSLTRALGLTAIALGAAVLLSLRLRR